MMTYGDLKIGDTYVGHGVTEVIARIESEVILGSGSGLFPDDATYLTISFESGDWELWADADDEYQENAQPGENDFIGRIIGNNKEKP